MNDEVTGYVFRDHCFARNGNTVVIAVSLEVVMSVYGSGGLFGEGGVATAFGGCAFFSDGESGPSYVGVWGARKASRFRVALARAGTPIKILRGPPPVRLMFWQTKNRRCLRPSDKYRDLRSCERAARLFRDRRAPPG